MPQDSQTYAELVEIRRRLDALEASVARLTGAQPVAPPAAAANGVDPDIVEIAHKDGIVRAIWVLRSRNPGLDLAHAKARVEAALRE